MRPIAPAALAGGLLLAAVPPATQTVAEPYLAVHAGPNFLQAEDLDVDGGGRIEPEYAVGYHLGGAAGYDFGMLRIEGEVSFQHHEIDDGDADGLPVAVGGFDGDAAVLSFLVNGYIDLDLEHPLTPFVGFGAGVARVGFDAENTAELIDGDDTVPAVQALVGVSFDVDETWTTAFAYRFFAALGAELDGEGPLGGSSAETDLFSHALRFEARYRF